MKKLLSMVLCAMMALTLAGCGGSGGDSSTYTFSSELDIKNLDSSDADDGCSFTAMHAVIDGLMKTDKKGNIVNGVASSSEVSDDGLTHTYKIRKDAKWANGDPVTANDFVYAWHRIFQKKGQYYYMFCDGIASIVGAQEMSDKIDNEEDITDADLDAMGVKAVDDKTLEITLEYSVPYFLSLTDTRAMYPVREDLVEKYGESYGANVESMVGCGPFKMTSWKRNSKIELEKNENYWDGDVNMDEITVRTISDGDTLALALQSGEINAAYGMAYASYPIFENDNFNFTSVQTSRSFYVQMNYASPIVKDDAVREAIAMGIDKESFVSVLLNGYGYVATGAFPDTVEFGGSTLNAKNYDPEGAKAVLEEAGWTDSDGDGIREKDGQKLTVRWLTYPSRQELPLLAESAQSTLKDIGMDVQINATADHNTIVKDTSAWDVYVGANVNCGLGDPTNFFSTHCLDASTKNRGQNNSD